MLPTTPVIEILFSLLYQLWTYSFTRLFFNMINCHHKPDSYFVLWKCLVYFIYLWMLSWVTVYKRCLFWNIWWPNHYRWILYFRGWNTCLPGNMVWRKVEKSNRAGKRMDTKSEVSKVFWMPEGNNISVFLESLEFSAHMWKCVCTVFELRVCSSCFFLIRYRFPSQRCHIRR